MSPLPHQMARIICITGTASNLHGAHSRVRGDLGREVKGLGGGDGGRGDGAGDGHGEGCGGVGEHGAAGGEERDSAGGRGAREAGLRLAKCRHRMYGIGERTYRGVGEGLRSVAGVAEGRATALRQRRAFMMARVGVIH